MHKWYNQHNFTLFSLYIVLSCKSNSVGGPYSFL